MPFLWASGIDGREGFDGNVSQVNSDFKDLVKFVDVGTSMRLRAYKPPFGWYAELNYVKLSDDAATPSGNVNVTSEQTFAEAGVSYDLREDFALYGGLRYQQVDLTIKVPGSAFRRDKGWTDAVAGVRWTPVLTDHWVAWARADVGGGGSNHVWLAEVGAGYRFGSRWGSYLSYRVLDTNYKSSGFLYDIRQKGLLLGFGARF